MAKTLLNGVNELLKKVGVLDNETTLASLTDSAHQTSIDLAVQVLNEVLDELYESTDTPKPKRLFERTITINAGDRDYALHPSLVRLRTEFHLIDETNNHTIFLSNDDDAYRKVVLGDIEQDDTGKPTWGAIRPTDGFLVLDRIPTADIDGNEYKYRFDGDVVLDSATDSFPITDASFRALIPAATEIWKRYRQNSFDAGIFRASLGRAARLIRNTPLRDSYLPSRHDGTSLDPLEP